MSPARWIAGGFDPRGRLSRRAYGRRLVGLVLVAGALLCLTVALAAHGARGAALAAATGLPLTWVVGLAWTARRLHDRGRSGLWAGLSPALSALSALPVERAADAHPVAVIAYTGLTLAAALWLLVETLGRRGTAGPNRYGPVPPA